MSTVEDVTDNIGDVNPSAQHAANAQPATNVQQAAAKADEPPVPTESAPAKPSEQAKAPVWTWNGAILAVRAQYKDALAAVSLQYDPIIRDGSVIEYYLPGSSNLLAQGRIRIGNQIVTDQSGNAYLPVAISDINYPRQQSIVRFQ